MKNKDDLEKVGTYYWYGYLYIDYDIKGAKDTDDSIWNDNYRFLWEFVKSALKSSIICLFVFFADFPIVKGLCINLVFIFYLGALLEYKPYRCAELHSMDRY